MSKGIVYDAAAVAHILGVRVECNIPAPKGVKGQMVVYYGGWKLSTLRECAAGRQRMWQGQHWYDDKDWMAEAGYYRLLLPAPGTRQKCWNEQVSFLRSSAPDFQPAPVCVAATGLLVHLQQTGWDLLGNDWCRCAERLAGDRVAELTIRDRRLSVDNHWAGNRYGAVCLAAARRF